MKGTPRPGLEPGLRSLVVAMAAIGPADWPRFAAALVAGREAGLPRAEAEELLLQATLFFGFPRVVTAFERLESVWPAADPPAGGGLPRARQAAAGAALFERIYGRNEQAVRARLLGFHREFHDFVLEAAYGRVLARPGLTPRVRELLAVAALAVLDQVPQLLAHGRGALAFGATRTEIREALWSALGDGRRAGRLARRIGAPR